MLWQDYVEIFQQQKASALELFKLRYAHALTVSLLNHKNYENQN